MQGCGLPTSSRQRSTGPSSASCTSTHCYTDAPPYSLAPICSHEKLTKGPAVEAPASPQPLLKKRPTEGPSGPSDPAKRSKLAGIPTIPRLSSNGQSASPRPPQQSPPYGAASPREAPSQAPSQQQQPYPQAPYPPHNEHRSDWGDRDRGSPYGGHGQPPPPRPIPGAPPHAYNYPPPPQR